MLNEKEASQLSDIEFKELVIRKLNELTVLELSFMVLTGSNSDLFRALGFIISPVGKGERRKKWGGGRREAVSYTHLTLPTS